MDHIRNISKSFFITNFPEFTTSKDLWGLCQMYGKVVDVFISNRKSKAGKRFAFVRFIKVENVERFVGNLCTLWIGRYHLQENVARFERKTVSSSFVHPVKSSTTTKPDTLLPAIVLDDECLIDKDLSNTVMGEVHHFSSLNNIRVLLHNEGFSNVEISYLGGLWVLIKLGSDITKLNFLKHLGVASWFNKLCIAQNDFVVNERIGEVLDVENSNDDMFARKRLCIKTNLVNNILDSFKIIVKGKVFMARAKELFVWSLSFKDVPKVTHCSDVESLKNISNNNVQDGPGVNIEEESDCDAVSDTFFGDSDEVNENAINQSVNDKESSRDPFGIYELLKKSKADGNSESSIPSPPGYTPDKGSVCPTSDNLQEMQGDHMKSSSCTPRVFEEMENPDIYVQSVGKDGKQVRKEGGSILDALDDMIKVGTAMGFKMDGCINDMVKIIGLNGELEETKKECFFDLEIKYIWGNYQFDHVESEALGLSGGILCVWDYNVFKKSHHIISDNFIALYGLWLPKKIQVLIISVYAPQAYSTKCQLWDYIVSIISQWRGEYIVLGDFNEVRCKEER
ncbi:RNA-directed DNA polymerase, eukaryota [Tanacetum coccineum]